MKKLLSIIIIFLILLSVLIIPYNFEYRLSTNELPVEYEVVDDHEEPNSTQPDIG
jgi:uncharacterized protein YpmB